MLVGHDTDAKLSKGLSLEGFLVLDSILLLFTFLLRLLLLLIEEGLAFLVAFLPTSPVTVRRVVRHSTFGE